VWILGSSLYGAELAAYLGLPFAFASHFAPAMLGEAFAIYRRSFRPSARLQRPYAMLAAGVCAADTDEEAHHLRSSQILAFGRLLAGRPGKLPRPAVDVEQEVPPSVLAQVRQSLSCSATGSRASIQAQLATLVDRYQPDEVIVTGMIHDQTARVRSFEIAAEVLRDMRKTDMAA
jgi:luciferase family oxidoreductase group 1